jgi:methyltransferase (TIGR00027 family)
VLTGRPSRTALAAARYRAEHQVLEGGRLFSDPLALRILGESAGAVAREADPGQARRLMRLFIALRARFAEDALAAAVALGVRQVVILGAGLDTLAYRGTLPADVRVFEVDHPATQEWKRRLLSAAAIPIPGTLTFAPVDFEREDLMCGLARAGFARERRTFFTWLGVVPYLSEPAVWSTLELVAGLPDGADVVFDYSTPPDTFPPWLRAFHDRRAARVAEIGEAFVSFFETDVLHARLAALGFSEIEDLSPSQIAARCLPDRSIPPSRGGGRVLRAASPGHGRRDTG